ncbi:MAG: DUF1934 domain-containing protein [Clostridia bacterium]|nr:DUF1934 domain-containing protein [Clostridia bacterium]
MRKNVILSAVGYTKNHGIPEDAVKLFTTGFLSDTDGGWRLRYSETEPETNAKSRVTLTMSDGAVEMTREGPMSTSMVFKTGQRFQGVYATPYGQLDMGIFPSEVQYRIGSDDGEINISYQLDLQGQHAADHELHIRFADKASHERA